jgi:tetratricopeptide (TPR) repeat protein
MSGRIVLAFLASCLLAGLSFCQVLDPTQNSAFGRRGALPDSSVSNISGVVSGSDGAPVADAHVELRNEQTGQTVISAYTNAGGCFEFNNFPTGQYELVATRGLSEAREHLTLSDVSGSVKIRLNTTNAAAAQADGNSTVSVAEFKVPQKARDALHKAQEAVAKNRRDEAEKHLSKALNIYPDYAPALTLRGVLSLDDNKLPAAVDDFDKAIHSDPGFAMAYTGMAAAMNQLQKFDDALRSADRAVALAPRSWQTYFEMAKSYIGKIDYRSALVQLSKAQEFETTDYAPIHLIRAHALAALRQYNDASGELQAFLTLAPNDPNSEMARQALAKIKAFTAASAKPAIGAAVK